MQKVYLLLRNNKESGPYSLQELLLNNLQPFDLVWVEGKSAGWRFPSEIDSLINHVDWPSKTSPASPAALSEQTAFVSVIPPVSKAHDLPRRVHVSLPSSKSGQRNTTSAVSQIALAADHATAPPEVESYSVTSTHHELKTNYRAEKEESEKGYVDWLVKIQSRKKSASQRKTLIGAFTAVAIIVIAFLKLFSASDQQDAATGISQARRHTSESDPSPQPQPVVEHQEQSFEAIQPGPVINASVEKPTVSPLKLKPVVPATKRTAPVETEVPESAKKDVAEASTQAPSTLPVVTQSQAPGNDEAAPVKKQSKGILGGIFKKREKKAAMEDVESEAQPKPSRNREAVKRGDEGNADHNTESLPDISSQISLASNADDNWMMGINDLKISINNRSASFIKTMAIEVQYLDDSNHLLETKTVVASNIPAGKKASIVGPSHKIASKVKLSVNRYELKNSR